MAEVSSLALDIALVSPYATSTFNLAASGGVGVWPASLRTWVLNLLFSKQLVVARWAHVDSCRVYAGNVIELRTLLQVQQNKI